MRKGFVIYLTFFFLLVGLIVSGVWLFSSEGKSKFEPGLTVIGLFATMTGVFAERFASSYERKRELMIAFYRELGKNREILKDSRFKLEPAQLNNPVVFPRLISSVAETAIASGVFEEEKYRDVFFYLNEWRDIVNEFNHRLEITELRTFTNDSPEEIRSFYIGLKESREIEKILEVSQVVAHRLKGKYFKRMNLVKIFDSEVDPIRHNSVYEELKNY